MGRVLTNNVGLAVTVESAVGTAGTSWFLLQPNTIGAYGANITTVPRRPISNTRGRRKGAVTDLDSTVEFEADLTLDQFAYFIEGYVFAEFANTEFDLKAAGAPPTVDGGTPTGYTVSSASTLLASKVNAGSGFGTLVYATGYAVAANNGVKLVTTSLSATDTEVVVSGLATEASPPANASLQVAGVRTDDVTVTITSASAGTGTLVSAADITDWSAYGLFPGMLIHVGGVDTDDTVTNNPNIGSTEVYGYARVVSIDGATLTFDKAGATLTAGGAGSDASGTHDILFGRFARNVATTADADDGRYLERTFQFEAEFPGIASNGTDSEFEYAVGNFGNELTLNVPLTEKATVGFNFIGTNSDPFVASGSRKTGASSAVSSLRETAFSTAGDLVSISTDLISSVSDVCFKSMTFTMLNNVSPEKCLGTLGATFVNAGLFEFNIEGQLAFTTSAIIAAIRNNTTVTFGAIFRNEDGAIGFDVPEMTVSGGGREYPVDQTVLVNLTGESFTSNTYGHDVGVSIFPVVPLAA